MPYCPNCGTQIEENTAFCPKCGSQLGILTGRQQQFPGNDKPKPFTFLTNRILTGGGIAALLISIVGALALNGASSNITLFWQIMACQPTAFTSL